MIAAKMFTAHNVETATIHVNKMAAFSDLLIGTGVGIFFGMGVDLGLGGFVILRANLGFGVGFFTEAWINLLDIFIIRPKYSIFYPIQV